MQNPELESGREESHKLPHREIDRCDVGTEQNHGNHDHDGGINELLVFFESLFLGIPGPGGLLQLSSDFTEVSHQLLHRILLRSLSFFRKAGVAGQPRLELGTNGFGDRYSTN